VNYLEISGIFGNQPRKEHGKTVTTESGYGLYIIEYMPKTHRRFATQNETRELRRASLRGRLGGFSVDKNGPVLV
jgi:hypothetical protein